MGERQHGGDGCKVKSDIVGQVIAGTGQREKESKRKTFFIHLTDLSPRHVSLNNWSCLCSRSLSLTYLINGVCVMCHEIHQRKQQGVEMLWV